MLDEQRPQPCSGPRLASPQREPAPKVAPGLRNHRRELPIGCRLRIPSHCAQRHSPLHTTIFLNRGGGVPVVEQSEEYVQTEQYVASLYRALGYRVERDVLVDGNQIDVVASKVVPAYGILKLLVEVKLRHTRPIGKDEVLSFRFTARSLIEAGQFSKAVMVSTSGFTRTAKLSIEADADIELLDIIELERAFLTVDAPLSQFIAQYQDKPINRCYIDLNAQLQDQYPQKSRRQENDHCAASELLNVAFSNPGSAVLLFADYGAGKTTSLERIKATAARNYLSNRTAPVPILFALKELGESDELDGFIRATFQRELWMNIPSEAFWDLCGQGRFLFLLDGFDEITLRADVNRRAELLRRLSPLLFGPSPALLTSRPSFFVSAQEYKDSLQRLETADFLQFGAVAPGSLEQAVSTDQRIRRYTEPLRSRYQPSQPIKSIKPTYRAYRLCLLTSEQIDEYLERYDSEFRDLDIESTAAVRHFVDSVYDLSDLIRRPIILDMIVATILNGAIDVLNESIAIGPADLYEAYAGLKLELDWDKAQSRRTFLSPRDRLKFAEKCALFMHDNDVLELGEDVLSSLAMQSIVDPLGSREELLTDLRTCSFLTISDGGSLRFIHRSFQEFFLARLLKQELDSNRLRLLRRSLPRQVLYFLGAFAFSDDDFKWRLLQLPSSEIAMRGSPEEVAAVLDNLAASVMCSRERIPNVVWKDFSVEGVTRRRLTFVGCRLGRVGFDRCSVDTIEFSDCTLDSARLNFTSSDLVIRHCRGSAEVQGDIATATVVGGNIKIDWSARWAVLNLRSCSSVVRLIKPALDIRAVGSRVRISGEWRGDADIRMSTLVLDQDAAIWSGLDAERAAIIISIRQWSRMSGRWRNCITFVSGKRSRKLGESERVQYPIIEAGLILADATALLPPPVLENTNCFVLGGQLADLPKAPCSLTGIAAPQGVALTRQVQSEGGLLKIGPKAWIADGTESSWPAKVGSYVRDVERDGNIREHDTFPAHVAQVLGWVGLPRAVRDSLKKEFEVVWRSIQPHIGRVEE